MAARGLESLSKVVGRCGFCPAEVVQIVGTFRAVEDLDVQHVSYRSILWSMSMRYARADMVHRLQRFHEFIGVMRKLGIDV